MMRKVLFVIVVLLSVGMFCACSNPDDEAPLVLLNQWVLVSYGSESNEVLKEAKGYYYLITFHRDGTYSGKAYGNKIVGSYECIGNHFKFIDGNITQLDVVGADPDKFFLEHLYDVYTYTITETELRLYYSKDQYFKFRVQTV